MVPCHRNTEDRLDRRCSQTTWGPHVVDVSYDSRQAVRLQLPHPLRPQDRLLRTTRLETCHEPREDRLACYNRQFERSCCLGREQSRGPSCHGCRKSCGCTRSAFSSTPKRLATVRLIKVASRFNKGNRENTESRYTQTEENGSPRTRARTW